MAVDTFKEASDYTSSAATIMSAEVLYVNWKEPAPAFSKFDISSSN
jgi:hypothetical protein